MLCEAGRWADRQDRRLHLGRSWPTNEWMGGAAPYCTNPRKCSFWLLAKHGIRCISASSAQPDRCDRAQATVQSARGCLLGMVFSSDLKKESFPQSRYSIGEKCSRVIVSLIKSSYWLCSAFCVRLDWFRNPTWCTWTPLSLNFSRLFARLLITDCHILFSGIFQAQISESAWNINSFR